MLFENSRFTPMMWMHMFFMRFAIDIVFLGRGDKVIRINRRLRPWRVSAMVFGARRALELEAGAADRSSTQVGDQISSNNRLSVELADPVKAGLSAFSRPTHI